MKTNRDLVINRITGVVVSVGVQHDFNSGDPRFKEVLDYAINFCDKKDFDIFNPKDEFKLTKELHDKFKTGDF